VVDCACVGWTAVSGRRGREGCSAEAAVAITRCWCVDTCRCFFAVTLNLCFFLLGSKLMFSNSGERLVAHLNPVILKFDLFNEVFHVTWLIG